MKKRIKKAFAYVLSSILILGLFTFVVPQTAITAKAAMVKDGKNTNLGLSKWIDHNSPIAKVYFDGNGDKWDVIGYNGTGAASTAQTSTTEGDITLLLSGSTGKIKFDDTTNVYADSLLKTEIEKGVTRLTELEKKAVKKKTLVTGTYSSGEPYCDGVSDTQVNDAYMWPLSTNEAVDAFKTSGYSRLYNDDHSGYEGWWLRSPGDADNKVAYVDDEKYTINYSGEDISNIYAVRPALNIKLSSILFISQIPRNANDREYNFKFTLIDDENLSAAINTDDDFTRSGSTISVPYTVSAGTDRVSILITDKEYTEEDATIKYYGALKVYGSVGTSGRGKFTLPGSFNSSTDKIYIIAEKINDDNMTDYACTPVPFDASYIPNNYYHSYNEYKPYPYYTMTLVEFITNQHNSGSTPEKPNYVSIGNDIDVDSCRRIDNVYVDWNLNGCKFIEYDRGVMCNLWIEGDSVFKLINCSMSGEKGGIFKFVPGVLTVKDNSTLILEDVNITGSQYNGIAVFDNAKLIIRDGTVIENCDDFCIYAEGNASVIMEGGTLSYDEKNGGVYLKDNATFTMKDGTLKCSKSYNDKKGVFLKDNALFKYYKGTLDTVYYNSDPNYTVVTYMPNYPGDTAVYKKAIKESGGKLDSNIFNRPGLAVGSWNTQPDGQGTSYAYDAEVSFDSETTLYAMWTDVFDINYYTDGGAFISSYPTNYSLGNTISLPTENDIKKDGYTFDGWYDNKDFNGSKITSISDTEYGHKYVYLKWTANQYTVDLVPNGGTINSNNVDSYISGTGATLPDANDMSMVGYTFDGWYDNEKLSGNSVTEITATDFGDKTYYAKWSPISYTVVFDANDGSGTTASQSRTYDDGAQLNSNSFAFEGHTFAGWNTSADGTGIAYTENATANLSAAEGDTVTLYAQWTTNEYVITWANEDGTVLETDTDAEYGSTPVFNGEDPKKAATAQYTYKFDGWTPDVTTVTGSATYTAKFTSIVNNFTITFDANGGTVNPSSDITNDEFKLNMLPTPNYEGHEFLGWFTTAKGGKEITIDTEFSSDQTIYAHYNNPEEPEDPEEPEEPEIPEEEPEEPEKEADYLDDLYLKLAIAVELGGEQTVYWNVGDSLPYDVLRYLVEHPQITLIFDYTYEDVEYSVTLCGKDILPDPEIPWAGPLYLLGIPRK